MGERLDAEAVRELMFTYFHEMRSAIERHEGTVEKFIGDAIMAVFGVPEAHEDDPLRACRAAFEIQLRVPQLNRELESRYGCTLALRIGVSTGEVVAGDSSTKETFASGDAVNAAARLEQAAGPGEVLLGEATYAVVKGLVDAERLEPIRARGKAKALAAHRLVSVALSPLPRRRLQTPLVGRDNEMAALRDAYEETLSTRKAKLALVIGEPGVGKSRLAEEFLATIADNARALSGRCLPYGEGITYWPLAEIIRAAAGIHDEHDRDQAQSRIRAVLHDALLADSLSTAVGLKDGAASPEEIAWAARRLAEHLALERPLVLHFDDVQWAEEAMFNLVTAIAERGRGPILLLCLARPELVEKRPALQPTISLGPLDESDTSELARRLVTGGGVGQGELVNASGGNPLFLEELAVMFTEESFTGTDIPPTLEALLAARLDMLPEMERAAAERAAIEGQLFHRGAVIALSNGAGRQVPRALRALEERELVTPAPTDFVDEAAFRFRHLLIRDAAYTGISKRLRSELHERFADWLENKVGERLAEVEEIVAHHLEQAYRYMTDLGPADERARSIAERAADRLAAAGRRALARSDVPAALSLLDRAGALLPEASEARLQLLPDLGDAYIRAGELERGQVVLREAIERADAAGNERLASSATVQLLASQMLTAPEGWAEAARREVARLIPYFEELGDDVALARLWHVAGLMEAMACRFAGLLDAEQRAVAHAIRAGDPRSEAEALDWLINSFQFGPTPAVEGVERLNELIERKVGNRSSEPSVLIQRAVLRGMLGDFEGGRRDIERATEIYEELGLSLVRAWPEMMAGQLELLAGDAGAAERHLRLGCELLEQMGERSWLSTVAGLLALALVAQGHDDDAEHFIEVSRESGASDDVLTQVIWRHARVRVLIHRGRLFESEALAREAIALAEPTDMLNFQGGSLVALAEVLESAKRGEEAAAAVEQALSLYERKGNVVMTDRARAFLGELRAGVRS